MKNKFIFLVILVLLIIFKANSFSQNLIVELDTVEFSKSFSKGQLKMILKNNSEDSVLISLEPFTCEIIDNPEQWNVNSYYGDFRPNKLTFIKIPKEKCKDGSMMSTISFLKFPKILQIAPKSTIYFYLSINKNIQERLNNFTWQIKYDIVYANKNEVNRALNNVYKKSKVEFEKSIFSKDSISIELALDDQIVNSNEVAPFNSIWKREIKDSTLYFYKEYNSKIESSYKSSYDMVLTLFRFSVN